MQDFVHLHVHSEYSLLDGLARIEDLVEQAKKMNYKALALTDHGAMYGVIHFYLACRKAGIKPIIGIEAYMAGRSRFDKQPGIDRDQYHLLLLAKNLKGYQNLLKLVSQSHLEGFYYKPRIDMDLLAAHKEGLIALSGCMHGEISELLLQDSYDKAKNKAGEFLNIFGEENFYLEIQRHPLIKDNDKVNSGIIELSRDLGLALAAANDIHYLDKSDAEAHEILLCIGTQKTILEKNRSLSMIDSPDFYLKSVSEMNGLFADLPEALVNTVKIAAECDLDLNLGKWILPEYEVPGNTKASDYLPDLVNKGLAKRYGHLSPEIKSRAEYELSIILKKKYETYFLIVSDFVNWAKSRGISVGPGRGSVAGSIVSYALGITDIDPLYFKLPFERFLNPDRPSPPDIDLDFADNRRDEVIKYVTEKYGQDKVAQIITFGTMEARAAIRDVGRALGMPYALPDRIAKMIPAGSQGFPMTIKKAISLTPDLRRAFDNEADIKRLLLLAQKLEGVARHSSVHAAGVVIADKTITEYTPIQRENRQGKIITQYDMYTVGEDGVGLLKIDFLGLRNLTIIEETLKYIKAYKGISLELSSLDLSDVKTYELLSKGETTGIFQLESAGMRRYIKDLKPTTIFDLMAMVALYRPGPMQIIPDFISRKHHPEMIKYPDLRLKDVLKESYGLLTYQDDVLLTAIKLAGYSWLDADKLRKAVGKKIPSEMKKQEKKFINGCVSNGLVKSKAKELFELIAPFAGYGFNKAHAACYSIIAFRTAYLKAHYPVEFMTALLTAESRSSSGPQRDLKLSAAVEECRRMKIALLKPDINKSDIEFTIENQSVRFGLSAIKNVGSAAISAILTARKQGDRFGSLIDFCEKVDLAKVNKKTMESLIKAGAFDDFGKRSSLLLVVQTAMERIHSAKRKIIEGQESLFSGFRIDPFINREDKLPDLPEIEKKQLLSYEKELLGFYLTEHPLRNVFKHISKKITHQIKDISPADKSKTVILGGIVSRLKQVITKNSGQEMAFVTLEDLSGSIELVVFPKTWVNHKEFFIEDNLVLVKGKIDERSDRVTIIVDAVKIAG